MKGRTAFKKKCGLLRPVQINKWRNSLTMHDDLSILEGLYKAICGGCTAFPYELGSRCLAKLH